MRKRLYQILTVVGVCVMLLGIVLYFLAGHGWSIPLARPDLAPWGVSFLGIIMIVCGSTELLTKKTKEEEINERDERNIALHNAAMATAFEVMNLFFGIGLVALAMLGYMNLVSFFTLIILYLLSNAIYVLRLRRLEKEF